MKTLIQIFPAAAMILWQIAPATGQDGSSGGGSGGGGGSSSSRSYRTTSSSKARDSIPPLFIEFTPVTRESAATMDEDLSVMTRIIDKALDQGLGEDMPQVKLNLPMLYTTSGRSVRAMYLEGFGALFMVKVNFPVVAPEKMETRKEEKAPPSEWEQTQKELRDLDERETDDLVIDPARAEFDSSQIESLKKLLLQSLKHAVNIRGLKPDEFVALSVFGSEVGGAVPVIRAKASTAPAAGIAPAAPASPKKKSKAGTEDASAEPVDVAIPTVTARPNQPLDLSLADGRAAQALTRVSLNKNSAKAGSQGSVLNLRVKKSDVDAFARGQMKLETFQQKAVFNAYVGNGYGVLSVNSWAGSSSGSKK